MVKKRSPIYTTWQNVALLVARVVVSFMMIMNHGYSKLQKLLTGGTVDFADPFGLGAGISLGLTVFAEVVCSALIAIGLLTRLATIPLIITMTVAAFMIHMDDPLRKMESSIIFLLVYILIAAFGPGKYSVDGLKR